MSRGHCMIPQFGLACPLCSRVYPSLLPFPACPLWDKQSKSPVLSVLFFMGHFMYPCPVQRSLYDKILSCPACPPRIESIHLDLLSCPACPIGQIHLSLLSLLLSTLFSSPICTVWLPTHVVLYFYLHKNGYMRR
jgi:hypothetical protein